MIGRARNVVVLLFILSSSVFAAQAQSAQKSRQGSLIAESKGTAGRFEVGKKVDEGIVVEPMAGGVLRSKDDVFYVQTGTGGKIWQISTSDPRAFTERLIRPKRSTARDVLVSYGKPQEIEFEKGGVTLRYGQTGHQLEFTIEWAGGIDRQSYDLFLAARVDSLAIEGH